jgi:hypothetical protein
MPVSAYGIGRARAGLPRARRNLLEGGADPRARRSSLEGSVLPRTGRSPPEEACALERGGVCSRGSLSGPPWWAIRATVAWAVPCVVKRGTFGFGLLRVLSGDSPVV